MLFFNTRTNSGEEEIEVYVGHKNGCRTIEENAMASIALYYSKTTKNENDYYNYTRLPRGVYEKVLRRAVALIAV